MFGKNEKVSRMQIGRMLALQLLATVLFLPSLLAGYTFVEGVVAIVVGSAVNAVLCLTVRGNSALKMPVGILYGIYLFLIAGLLLCQMVEIIQVIFLPGSAALFWLVLLMLMVFYAVISGLEAQLRMFDVVFWYCVAIVLFVVIVWCVYLGNHAGSGAPLASPLTAGSHGAGIGAGGTGNVSHGRLLSGIICSFLTFAPLLQCVELNTYKNKNARTRKGLLLVLVFTTAAALFFYVLGHGMFGSALLSEMKFPILVLFTNLSVLQKGLAFIAIAWLTTILCVVVAAAGYWQRLLIAKPAKKEMPEQTKKKKRCITGAFSAAIIFVIGCAVYRYDARNTDWLEASGVAEKQSESRGFSERELENQTYPLAVGIDRTENGSWSLTFCYAENKGGDNGGGSEEEEEELLFTIEAQDMDDAKKQLELIGKGILNDSHIQVLVLGEKVLGDGESMDALAKNWYSLKNRFGSALCFYAGQVEDALKGVQENIRTYSAWKKLRGVQAEESDQPVYAFEVFTAWEQYGDEGSWQKKVPKLPFSEPEQSRQDDGGQSGQDGGEQSGQDGQKSRDSGEQQE